MIVGFTAYFRRLSGDQRGAALVEFGLVVPIMFLFLAVVIDGGRMAWIYQSASYGVRDAARMVARIAPADLCPSGSLSGYDTLVTDIVAKSISDTSVFPTGARVVDVTPSIAACVTGGYRNGTATVIEVNAQIEIDYIWGGVFGFFGTALGPLNTTISDQSRVYGL
jgi:Flp pilus assembly protein TadG